MFKKIYRKLKKEVDKLPSPEELHQDGADVIGDALEKMGVFRTAAKAVDKAKKVKDKAKAKAKAKMG